MERNALRWNLLGQTGCWGRIPGGSHGWLRSGDLVADGATQWGKETTAVDGWIAGINQGPVHWRVNPLRIMLGRQIQRSGAVEGLQECIGAGYVLLQKRLRRAQRTGGAGAIIEPNRARTILTQRQ